MSGIEQFKLKKLDTAALSFEANGKTYHNINTISLGRGIQYELFLLELQTGKEVSNYQSNMKSAYDLLNDKKFADAAVLIHNLMTGTEVNLVRMNAALKICCLIMCSDGEDARAELTEEQIAEKIDDWIIEGYTKEDFFHLAVTFAYGSAKN